MYVSCARVHGKGNGHGRRWGRTAGGRSGADVSSVVSWSTLATSPYVYDVRRDSLADASASMTDLQTSRHDASSRALPAHRNWVNQQQRKQTTAVTNGVICHSCRLVAVDGVAHSPQHTATHSCALPLLTVT